MSAPLTHNNVFQLVKIFYPSISPGGVCNGFTSMWIQASLLGPQQEKVFFQRLESIKEKYLKNGILDVKQIKIDVEAALQKGKGKARLTEEDLQLIDLRAFCENLALQHEPNKFRRIYNKFVGQHEKNEIYPLTSSKMLEDTATDKANILHFNEIGMVSLTKDEFNTYIESIKQTLKNNNGEKVCFFLSSVDHAMGLTYLPKEDKWGFTDINMENFIANLNSRELTNTLFQNYFKGQNATVSLDMVSRTPAANLTEQIKKVHGFKVPQDEEAKSNLLYIACKNGNLEAVRDLLKHSIDINKKSDFSALFVACQNNHLEIVKELIKNGANVNQPNITGQTPLHIVAYLGHMNIVEELLRNGANFNSKDKKGHTPKYLADHNGKHDIVEVLDKAKSNAKKSSHVGLAKRIAGIFISHHDDKKITNIISAKQKERIEDPVRPVPPLKRK